MELSPLVEAVRTNLAANGLKESDHEDTGPVQLVMPCYKVLRATQVVGRLWNYTSSRVDLFVYGLAYAPDSGAKVVDEVRAALPNCAPWVWGGNWNMTLLGQFKAITPAGIDDLVAYCHQQIGIGGTNKGLKQYTCDIVIGRGHLVIIVSTLGTSTAGAQNDAKNALPKAAKALIAAVPTA